ncbi:MAG: SOS response-associated peptidase [Actinomycetota bacterium]|nr:SOS response-associated peptidase [Actinomycetota bacterium]
MCGRYASSRRADDLVAEYGVDWVAPAARLLEPDYNVAPTKDVLAVRERSDPETCSAVRELRTMRWGLVPSWAQDPSGGGRLINARLESVADKPAFRSAFLARRCLLPADGYFEWYADAGGQPHFLHAADGGGLAMAGLYERWHPPGETDPASTLWTTTIITTAAMDAVGHLHDRMPVLLARESWAAWLDPASSDRAGLEHLLQAGGGQLTAYPVSKAVGNVAAGGAGLVAPVAAEPVQQRLL